MNDPRLLLELDVGMQSLRAALVGLTGRTDALDDRTAGVREVSRSRSIDGSAVELASVRASR
jgi:hypothetical protein